MSYIINCFIPPVRNIYPALFVGACAIHAADKLSNLLMKWAQSVRDSEYLLDMRLQNMEEKEKADKGKGKAVVKVEERDEAVPEILDGDEDVKKEDASLDSKMRASSSESASNEVVKPEEPDLWASSQKGADLNNS